MVKSLKNINHSGILCHIGRFLLFTQMIVAKPTFRAFPEALKCEELKHGWMEACGLYSFPCPKCVILVEAPQQLQKVSLCSN